MIAYIGLGSNLGEPLVQLQNALEKIHNDASWQLLKVSGFYRSKALTVPDSPPQADYVNAVAKLQTLLSPEQLLIKLNAIEDAQGRERKEKWGARTLDLDILLCDEQIIQTNNLVVPHAQMQFRNFVIHPLFEIAGAIKIPGLGNLAALAKKTSWDGLQMINFKSVRA